MSIKYLKEQDCYSKTVFSLQCAQWLEYFHSYLEPFPLADSFFLQTSLFRWKNRAIETSDSGVPRVNSVPFSDIARSIVNKGNLNISYAFALRITSTSAGFEIIISLSAAVSRNSVKFFTESSERNLFFKKNMLTIG